MSDPKTPAELAARAAAWVDNVGGWKRDYVRGLEHEVAHLREKLAAGRARADDMERELSTLRRMARRAVLPDLQRQVLRLREHRCPTMKFGISCREIADAVKSEVDEVLAEPEGSVLARTEAAGVLAVAAHLAMAHGALDLEDLLREETDRLRGRLDCMDRGLTWEEAKAVERAAAKDKP